MVAPPWVWLCQRFLPVEREVFFPHCHQVFAHSRLCDCRGYYFINVCDLNSVYWRFKSSMTKALWIFLHLNFSLRKHISAVFISYFIIALPPLPPSLLTLVMWKIFCGALLLLTAWATQLYTADMLLSQLTVSSVWCWTIDKISSNCSLEISSSWETSSNSTCSSRTLGHSGAKKKIKF